MENNRVQKEEQQIIASARQISEKKQDVKFDTRDYPINYLVNQYEKNEFYIPLEYQRKFIWGDKDRCFFIESILMGLPIPFMFFADTPDGRVEIVDGAQRTQTLVQFCQNDLELQGMQILTESNGFKFKDLDPAIQRRFLNILIFELYSWKKVQLKKFVKKFLKELIQGDNRLNQQKQEEELLKESLKIS